MGEPAATVARRPDVNRLPHREELPDDEWVARLSATGRVRTEAMERLHDLMVRAARHQVGRMHHVAGLGSARLDEIVQSAADEATLSVLSRLGSFEGRSRFTTWAYKFGILQAHVEVRRATWSDREVELRDVHEPSDPMGRSPEAHVVAGDLATAVQDGLVEALTPHQQRVAMALLVDEVPIDVLAHRLGTTRGALYKTVHDVRKRMRAYLQAQGLIAGGSTYTASNRSASNKKEVTT